MQYCLLVQGATAYLHPLSFYDRDTCLISETPTSVMWIRFSQIKKLHKDLAAQFPEETPDLPPNKWFGCRSVSAAEARKKELHLYFSKLLECERIRLCEPLSTFCQPQLSLNLCIVGSSDTPKMRLLSDFYRVNPSSLRTPLSPPAVTDDCYPERASLPIDLIIDRVLLRIKSIEVRNVDMTRLEELIAALEVKDGLIFAYSETKPETLEPVRILRHMLSVESILVALDCEAEGSRSAYPVVVQNDLVTVYEHLLQNLMRRQGVN